MLTENVIRPIVENYMIQTNRIMQLNDHGIFVDVTDDLYRQLLTTGVDYDDTWQILKLYFYFNFYLQPYELNANGIDTGINGLEYGEITGINQETHLSRFWKLPPFAGNRKSYNQRALRRGSEAQFVQGGEYVRESTIAEDRNPQFSVYRQTHAFSAGPSQSKFNWIYSRQPMDADNEGLWRFYFNVRLDRACVIRLIQNIQKLFDLYGIPFKLKFLARQPTTGRTDPVVLFAEQKYPFAVFLLVREIYKASSGLLRTESGSNDLSDVPLFVKRLDGSLGFADAPSNEESFGMFLCEILADALFFVGSEKDGTKRLKSVLKYIKVNKKYDVDALFRSRKPAFKLKKLFALFKDPIARPASPNRPIFIRPIDEADFFNEPGIKRTRFLIAAIRIAYQLCKEAYWGFFDNSRAGVKCNWLTYIPEGEVRQKLTDYGIRESAGSSELPFQVRASYDACTDEEVGQIAFFLSTISRFYAADLFQKTIEGAMSYSLVNPLPDTYQWVDTKLNEAWKALFDISPNGEVNKEVINPGQLEAIGDHLIEYYLQAGRPFGNCFVTETLEQNTYFCPTFTHGLTGVGYFFLYLYAPDQVRLPYLL